MLELRFINTHLNFDLWWYYLGCWIPGEWLEPWSTTSVIHRYEEPRFTWFTISLTHAGPFHFGTLFDFSILGCKNGTGLYPRNLDSVQNSNILQYSMLGRENGAGLYPGNLGCAHDPRPTQSFTLACENGVGLYPAFPTTFYESPTMGWRRWWRWILAMAHFSHWLPSATAFCDSLHGDPTSGLVYVPEDLLPQLWPKSWWWTPWLRMATITGIGHCDWNYIGCVETGENQTQERYQHPRPTSTTWLSASTWFEMVGAMAMCTGFQRTRNRHI